MVSAKRLLLLATATLLVVGVTGCGRTAPLGWTGSFNFKIDPPPVFRADGIRLATLNTEFMFDGADGEGEATFPHKGDPVLARAHRDRIGSILRMLDADVVVLQEVESDVAMQLLVDESLAGFGYTVHFVQGLDFFTGQNIGILSRVPIDTVGRTDELVRRGSTTELQGVSKNMFARLTLGGTPTTLIGVHFLARPDDPARKPRREAQAEVIRRLVVQELELGRAVAVVGDFNDFDDQVRDIRGSRPITNVLTTIKSARPGPQDDLHNVVEDVAQERRFTSHYDRNSNDRVEMGEFSAIDHVLLSPDLYRRLREVKFVHSHDPVSATDHFPIVVVFANNG